MVHFGRSCKTFIPAVLLSLSLAGCTSADGGAGTAGPESATTSTGTIGGATMGAAATAGNAETSTGGVGLATAGMTTGGMTTGGGSNLGEEVPFLAGQIGPSQWEKHNAYVDQIPDYVPNSAVISAEGTAIHDIAHFDEASAKIMGERYAEKFLEMIARP